MKLQITFAMWAISTAAMATTQIPDFIVLDGAREPVYSKPHILLTELQGSNEWKRQTHDPRCSASVRGYNSDWEVRDGMLFLIAVHLNPCAANPLSVPLERIFPSTKGPVPATWYTGVMVVPKGKGLGYLAMGSLVGHEKYLLISVRAGMVVSQKEAQQFPERP
jgi:hypothetical protein